MKTRIITLLLLVCAFSFSCKKTKRVENDQTAPTLKMFKVELVKEEVVVTELPDNSVLPVSPSSDFFIVLKAEDTEGVQNINSSFFGKCGNITLNVNVDENQFIGDPSPNDNSDVFVTRMLNYHITGDKFFGACTDPANPIRGGSIGASARNYNNLRTAVHLTLNASN